MISSAFSVDKNLYEGAIENALNVMQELFKNIVHTADVHFVFDENGEKVRIPAHKNILAIGSTVFADMFYGPDKHFINGDIPTRSSTVSARTFEAFISLFYGKNIILSASKELNLREFMFV